MTFRVVQIEGEPHIVLTAADLETLGLRLGDAVEVTPVLLQDVQYASTEEVLQAFEDTYAAHENSYIELAK